MLPALGIEYPGVIYHVMTKQHMEGKMSCDYKYCRCPLYERGPI